MKKQRRDEMLHIAEVVDAMRVFPRLFLASCFFWCVWVTYQLLYFYFLLPTGERTTQVTTLVTALQAALLGFLKLVYSDYRKDGRKWGQQPVATNTTATVATTTTTTAPTTS